MDGCVTTTEAPTLEAGKATAADEVSTETDIVFVTKLLEQQHKHCSGDRS
jgi:hypothetical protein